MEKTPLISVITICFNATETIGATLDSVKSQTFSDFEYIVQDGKSADDTVEQIKASGINGLSLVSESDKGIYDAMNRGLDRARGEYVVFLNAGDAFHGDDALQRVADAAEKNDYPGIIYGQTVLVDKNRRYIGPRHLTAPDTLKLKDFSDGMVVSPGVCGVEAHNRIYNTDYRFSADYEWCIRCLQHSRNNAYIGDKPLIEYLNEGATTRNRWRSLMERWRIMSMYFGFWTTMCKHLSFVVRAVKRKSL